MARINLGKVVPEKGIDYFTDAEVEEIKNEIKTEIDAQGMARDIELLKTDSGHTIEMTLNENYQIVLVLKNAAGTALSTQTIDLPNENAVTNLAYSNGILTVTKQSGATSQINLTGLIEGLVTESDFNTFVTAIKGVIGISTNTYNSTQTYNTGDIVVQSEKIYKANQDNITGTFDSSKWDEISLYEYQKIQDEAIAENYKVINKLNEKLENQQKVIDQLPQVEGQGTEVTLENTIEAPFTKFDVEGNSDQAILPEEYQQVDYIESTGTQYIDTGYTPVQGDNFEIKNVTTKSNGMIFYSGTGENQLGIFVFDNDGYYKYFATGAASHFLSPNVTNETIKIINGDLYYGKTLKAQSSYVGVLNTTLQIFRRPTGIAYISAEMGRFTITNGNAIKLDLIPCYKKSNNEIGFYDIINDEFYTNQGTGTFLKGNDVPNPNYEQPIESAGDNENIFDDNKNNNIWINQNGDKITTEVGSNCLKYNCSERDTFTISAKFDVVNGSSIILIAFYDKNDNLLARNVALNNEKLTLTKTAPAQTSYMYAGHFINKPVEIKLEKGNKASGYSPYGMGSINEKIKNADGTEEQDYSIYTQQPFRSNKDKTIKDKFVIKSDNKKYERHYIGEVVFDGSEDEGWRFNATSTTPSNRTVIITNNNLNSKYNVNADYLSNMFIKNSTSSNKFVLSAGLYLSLDDNLTGITPNDDNNVRLTKMLTYLSTHNVVVQYELAEPLDLLCTETQIQQSENKPSTYKEMTIINSQDETEAYLEVAGIYDLNKLITRTEVLESEV